MRLLRSSHIESPALIGWLRPAILIPIACLTQIMPTQLDAILAHELAHVRRHDYLLNLIQTAIETLLFFHPAVWWVSSCVRQEREYCCDDEALRVCRSRRTYASALAALQTLHAAPLARRPLALPVTGGSLLRRVRRIARPTHDPQRCTLWPAAALFAFAFLMTATMRQTLVSATAADRVVADAAHARTLEVRCVDEDGHPVAGAEVYAIDWVVGTDSSRLTEGDLKKTDVDGRVRFDGLLHPAKAAGQMEIYARIAGKLAGVAEQYWGLHSRNAAPTMATVILHPAVDLRGKVTAPLGVALDKLRAEVRAISRREGANTYGRFDRQWHVPDMTLWPTVFDASIDRKGNFVVQDVPQGAIVQLAVSGPGVARRELTGPRAGPGNAIAFSAELRKESSIEGTVVSGDGQPGASLWIEARGLGATGIWVVRAKSDATGHFRVDGLPAGTYSVRPCKLPDGSTSVPVSLRLGPSSVVGNVELKIESGIVVSGSVVEGQGQRPIAGAVIGLVSDEDPTGQILAQLRETDAQGLFFHLCATHCGAPLRVLVSRVTGRAQLRRTTARPARPEPAKRGREQCPVCRRRLPCAGRDHCAVSTARNAERQGLGSAGQASRWRDLPVGDARSGLGRAIEGRTLRTRLDGTYEIDGLIANRNARLSIPAWNTTAAESDPFVLKPGQTIELADLVVTARPLISRLIGNVVDDAGHPIDGANVWINETIGSTTDSSGEFAFDLYDAGKQFSIVASADSFETTTVNGITDGSGPSRIVLKAESLNQRR